MLFSHFDDMPEYPFIPQHTLGMVSTQEADVHLIPWLVPCTCLPDTMNLTSSKTELLFDTTWNAVDKSRYLFYLVNPYAEMYADLNVPRYVSQVSVKHCAYRFRMNNGFVINPDDASFRLLGRARECRSLVEREGHLTSQRHRRITVQWTFPGLSQVTDANKFACSKKRAGKWRTSSYKFHYLWRILIGMFAPCCLRLTCPLRSLFDSILVSSAVWMVARRTCKLTVVCQLRK